MYRGDCLKWGVGLFADLRGGGLGKKQGIVSEGGEVDTPVHTMLV